MDGSTMKKALPWFRMYSTSMDDKRLRLLAFEDRWHYVALLCCKCSGLLDDETNPDLFRRKIAVSLGIQVRELEEVARRLAEVELIDKNTLQPVDWDELQYQSDTSKDRVRAHRERKKKQQDNDMERHSNVTVTVQETDTDTDTDKDLYEPDIKTSGSLEPPPAEAKPKRRKRTEPPVPKDEIVELYHEVLPTLSRVLVLSDERERHIRARWKENLEGLDMWREYFEIVSRSKFLMGKVSGQGRRPFKADFDWLIREQNMAKVYEGKYHG